MYQILVELIENHRIERFVWKIISKPYPKIVLKHSGIGTSSLEFMSAADDANRILSWEGDWINIDEAGLLDNLDDTIVRLGTRLRGTVHGRARLGRLSLTTNPHVNPQLYYRFDLGEDNPDEYLSMKVSTRSNKNITDDQLKALINRIPERERDRWLDGDRPEAEGREFPASLVDPCEDEGLDEIMSVGIDKGSPGFIQEIAPKAGIVSWQLPYEEGRRYITAMDPGQGNAPYRNAPVIMVWDVTDFPASEMRLRGFWWGFGDGSYQPCISQFRHWHEYYRVSFGAFESTGSQVGFQEYFRLEEDMLVYGMSFAGNAKYDALVALKLLMSKQLIRWPKDIKALRQQMLSYKLPDKKITQDIVSCMSLAAAFARRFYYSPYEEDTKSEVFLDGEPARHDRAFVERFERVATR